MTNLEVSPPRLQPEPLPDNLRGVQPGGGVCYRAELAWGLFRRWYLKRFRAGYVRRMAALRRGSATGAPHEILDPRDLKYCRNQCQCEWDEKDDPFRYRDRLFLARWGLAELQLTGYPLAAATVFLATTAAWPLAFLSGSLLALVVYFFRDPPRTIPAGPGLLVAPCDGTVVEISELPEDEFIGGPAVRIGVFLSLFNVHVNRSPAEARVVRLRYSPGAFLNAMNPASAMRNENLWIGLEETAFPHRRLAVRQIAGLVARRIVCSLRPGETVKRGHKFGMIKLGSRTELIVPAEIGLRVLVKQGDRVRGGSTVLARYRGPAEEVEA